MLGLCRGIVLLGVKSGSSGQLISSTDGLLEACHSVLLTSRMVSTIWGSRVFVERGHCSAETWGGQCLKILLSIRILCVCVV